MIGIDELIVVVVAATVVVVATVVGVTFVVGVIVASGMVFGFVLFRLDFFVGGGDSRLVLLLLLSLLLLSVIKSISNDDVAVVAIDVGALMTLSKSANDVDATTVDSGLDEAPLNATGFVAMSSLETISSSRCFVVDRTNGRKEVSERKVDNDAIVAVPFVEEDAIIGRKAVDVEGVATTSLTIGDIISLLNE